MAEHIHIDEKLLEAATPVFHELGISVEQAINMFLAKAIRVRGLPFAVTLDDSHVKPSEPIPKISNSEITETLLRLVEQKLSDSEIQDLCRLDYCRETFGIHFAVLKTLSSCMPEDIRLAAKDDNNYNRYSTTRIAHRGNISFLLCTQWTDRHRSAFVRWLRRINH